MEKDKTGLRPKEVVLRESPLLRTFIDPYAEADFELWLKMTNKEFIRIRDEMLEIVDEKVMDDDINNLLAAAEEIGFFSKEQTEDSNAEITTLLTLIGFEVGNIKEVDLFMTSIKNQLILGGAIDEDPKNGGYIREIIKCGILWRKEIGEEVSPEIRKFVGKLKFED